MNLQELAEELDRNGLVIGPRLRDPRPIEEKYDMGPPTDREKAAKVARLKARLKAIKRRDARIRRAITLYTQQVEIHSERGACDPAYWDAMDERFNQSRAMLERVIFEEINNAYRQADR